MVWLDFDVNNFGDDRDGGKVGIGGFVYEGGKVDSAQEFSSKNGNKFQKPPPVKCILFT